MSPRYKDLRTAAALQREFPYEVEAATPEFGFRQRLNLIENWVTARLKWTDYGRWGRRREMKDYAVWAFRDAETAAAFKVHLEWVMGLSEKQATSELTRTGKQEPKLRSAT